MPHMTIPGPRNRRHCPAVTGSGSGKSAMFHGGRQVSGKSVFDVVCDMRDHMEKIRTPRIIGMNMDDCNNLPRRGAGRRVLTPEIAYRMQDW